MSEAILKFDYQGKHYELEARDLTVANLRQAKQWFGKEYGAYLPFIQLLMQFDADAVTMAIAIGKKKETGSLPDARNIDFCLSDLIEMQVEPEKVDEPETVGPTVPEPAAAPDTPTLDSSGTSSTTSDPSTSSTSLTSVA